MSAATIAMIAERDAGLLSQVTVPGLREWYLEKEAEEFEKSSPADIASLEQENAVLKAENKQLKASQELSHWFFAKNANVLREMEAEINALKAQVTFLNAQRIVLLSKYEPESVPGKDGEDVAAADAEEKKEKED